MSAEPVSGDYLQFLTKETGPVFELFCECACVCVRVRARVCQGDKHIYLALKKKMKYLS